MFYNYSWIISINNHKLFIRKPKKTSLYLKKIYIVLSFWLSYRKNTLRYIYEKFVHHLKISEIFFIRSGVSFVHDSFFLFPLHNIQKSHVNRYPEFCTTRGNVILFPFVCTKGQPNLILQQTFGWSSLANYYDFHTSMAKRR